MMIIIEVFKELVGMFLADAALSTATLVLVAIVATIVRSAPNDPLWGGGLLVFGCLAIVAGAALREANKRSTLKRPNRNL